MNRYLKSLLSVLTFGMSGIFDKDSRSANIQYRNSGEANNIFGSLLGRYTGSQMTNSELQASKINLDEAQRAREWSLMMDNTKMQRAVADYQAAGLNPMSLGSNGSVSVPSASVGQAVSPSAMAFNLPGLISSLSQLGVNRAQADALHSQSEQSKAAAENLRAEAALKDAQRKGQEFINEVNELTKDVQVEQKKVNLAFSQKQLEEIDKKMQHMEEDINLKREQANTELAKQAYSLVQQAVGRASARLMHTQANEIVQMLEYNKRLSEARTMHEKAAAGLAGVQAAYQNGLITRGYLDKLVDKVGAEAGIKLNEQQLSDIATALRTGDYSNTNINDKNLFQQIFTSEGFVQAATIFLDNFNPLSGLIGIAP